MSGKCVFIYSDSFPLAGIVNDIFAKEVRGLERERFVGDVASAGPCVAIVDLDAPDGREAALGVHAGKTGAVLLLMSSGMSDEHLKDFLSCGIKRFLFKPFHPQQCRAALIEALETAESVPRRSSDTAGSHFIGHSKASRDLRILADELRSTPLPVLLSGESGCGKEVAARELHLRSNRRDKPFMPVNCSTLGTLAESELFGHTRGAFTHAVRSTYGYVGAAQGGTLFLDEVGELGLGVQAKLLRFLDRQEYCKVGESEIRTADVRIISASNRDLKAMCLENTFRADLFFRLRGAHIVLPPLRERPEDIPLLARHFLDQHAQEGRPWIKLLPDALALLVRYEWPGNVRQLRQVLYLLSARCQEDVITASDVFREIHELSPANSPLLPLYKEAKHRNTMEFDTEYFTRVTALAGGSLKKALELTGMHKKNYYEKLASLNLRSNHAE